jgi:hypothetical protein
MADWRMRSKAGCLTRAIVVAFGILSHAALIEPATAHTDAGDSVETRIEELERQSAVLADENRQLQAQI